MNILGHGVDLVEVARVRSLLERHGAHAVDRLFTEAERAYCTASSKRSYEHFAARFAAKEATLKALGTGWTGGIAWTDLEVARGPNGQPMLKVTGEAARIADKAGITAWHVSLTHTGALAMASVLALGPG